MRSAPSLFFASMLAAAPRPGAGEGPSVVYKPLGVGGLHEFGQLQSGLLVDDNIPNVLRDEWIDHFGSFLTQEAMVEKRLLLQIGLGGIFEIGKPERVDDVFGGSQYKMFYIGPTVAKGTVLFGDPDKPTFTIGGGLFPFKYNPEAVNLGEYLFRAGPYPTYIMNGGVLVIGDNAAYLQGFHAAAKFGGLSLDLLFTTETGLPPLYDWSLSALAGYSIASGLLELGAGVRLARILQVKPSRTQRSVLGNSYFTGPNDTVYTGEMKYYDEQKNFWASKDPYLSDLDTTNDTLAFPFYRIKRDSFSTIFNTLSTWKGDTTLFDPTTNNFRGAEFYTPAGTLVMGRFSLDLKKIIKSPIFKPADLKLYGEVALLGVKDYPIFYEKKSERLPVMLGFNIPTFGLLDLCALQVEHFASPFLPSTYSLGSGNLATPYLPPGALPEYSRDDYLDLAERDDWAWSLLMRRTFLSSFTVSAQFAKDHLHTVGTNWFYGARLEPIEDMHTLSDWYWMVQFAWGI